MTTAISFSLEDAGFVENLTLSSHATSGTGNELNNVLTGNDLDNLLNALAGTDTLIGSGGSDTLLGGTGDDWYRVDGSDVVLERRGAGFDTVQTSLTHTLAANVEALILTGGDAVAAVGNALANAIEGNRGSNALYGRGGNDSITAGRGADTLNGGTGDDTMEGAAGRDVYIVNSTDDVVMERAGQGIDVVQSSTTITRLAANVENLRLMGTQDLDADGNSLGNSIYANKGGNALDGRAGLDTVSYEFGASSGVTVSLDVITAQVTGGSGTDTLTGFERLTGSRFADDLAGNDDANVLQGMNGRDALTGGGGRDTLIGGNGSDTLHGDSGNDSLSGGNGDDELQGGSGADTLAGGPGDDTFDGGFGNDTYVITDLHDVVIDTGGFDTVIVTVDGYQVPSFIENVVGQVATEVPYFVEALYVGARWGEFGEPVTVTYGFLTSPTAGADELGSSGFQPMTPAQENVVRAALAQWAEVSGIVFVEQDDALGADVRFGTNEQPSSLGYAYYPPEGDVYIDADAVTPYVLLHEIGHAIGLKHPGDYGSTPPYLPDEEDTRANTVMSYNGSSIDELGAFDIAAIQYLYGVNPGARSGNDTYLLAGGEPIIWDGGGTDTVSATGIAVATHIDLNDGQWSWIGTKSTSILDDGQYYISHSTAIENAIGGTAGDEITGNELANFLYGGSGNDTLAGARGDDTLVGGSGSDTVSYAGATSGVKVSLSVATAQPTGGAGSDTLSECERLTGSAYADQLTGASGNNVLDGAEGSDVLAGEAGNDTLTGGGGQDKFDFNFALNASTNVDRIADFNPADDTIRLDNDTFTAFATVEVALASGAFYAGAAAHDATDRIIYDAGAGNLYYDSDGSNNTSSAILFATLAGTPTLTGADFFVVA